MQTLSLALRNIVSCHPVNVFNPFWLDGRFPAFLKPGMGLVAVPEPSYRGKVRDVYDLGDRLILVATDRISAFDVVFPDPIPGKGRILTQISSLWFRNLPEVQHHLISTDIRDFPKPFCDVSEWSGRAVLVKKTRRINFEFVVRGYLLGSALTEYEQSGCINGQMLPPGMVAGSRLPTPVLTPTTKSDVGHDEPVSISAIIDAHGHDTAIYLEAQCLRIFQIAGSLLNQRGIVLLDTKMEFGTDDQGNILIIDELLTPDSSRYCREKELARAVLEKRMPVTMDKQIIREYLNGIGWNRHPPAPSLPEQVTTAALEQYQQIQEAVEWIFLQK